LKFFTAEIAEAAEKGEIKELMINKDDGQSKRSFIFYSLSLTLFSLFFVK
jgi:hypothetical protein